MSHDHASWQVKDVEILKELLELMNLTPEEATLIQTLKPQALKAAPALLEAFYGRLFSHTHTAEYLEGVAMDRLHSMVTEWFADIFNGTYDEAYALKRLKIGQVHVKVGLPVRYPLAMLDVILSTCSELAKESPKPEQAAKALRKALALDIAIFNQAYEDNQLSHLAELVGGERLARRLLSGQS